MVRIVYSEGFEKAVRKLDSSVKSKLIKQIEKIIKNPEIGKPLRYSLKHERSIYVRPYRLIYAIERDAIILLRFLHRKSVYGRYSHPAKPDLTQPI